MKDLVLILITFFSITSAQEWECPAVENLGDCLCYPKSMTIHCINSTFLANLTSPTPTKYNLIVFQNINSPSIEKDDLGNAIFQKIVIDNNLILDTLPIFKPSPEVLIIKNNPILPMESLYKVVNNLKTTQILQIENNDLITEVIPRAFDNSPVLKQILLQNSQIKKIAGQAFLGLPKLKEIRLDHNKELNQLDEKCFDVDSSIIDINLNSNNKIAKIANLSGITSKKTIINLNLENINLSRFPRSGFLPFLANNESTIYLSGNPINCSCDDEMKWVLDENYPSLSRQIIHLNCTNYNKEIFRLNRKDICEKETTTPSTVEPKPPTQQPIRTEVPQTTSEPLDPTEQKPRTDPSDVKLTTEPHHPSEQPSRKETVIATPPKEPNTPGEQLTRKESEPVRPEPQVTRNELNS